jgi:hypothetical protein
MAAKPLNAPVPQQIKPAPLDHKKGPPPGVEEKGDYYKYLQSLKHKARESDAAAKK